VASLLEVGTGFHPELTGRENVYLNGTILGMTRAEVKAKFDEIVAFAEVEKFLDTPVKRYSSGMYVRLAFAVAAHLEPEILVVDEVLAVGDAAFQKKCLGKMKDVSAGGGRTVLFVSHNMTAIASLCGRAILLDTGRINKIGAVHEVTKSYLAPLSARNLERERLWNDPQSAPGNDRIRIRGIAVLSDTEDTHAPIEMTTPFRIVVDYWNLVADTALVLNLYLLADDGTPVFESLTTEESNWFGRPHPRGLFRSTCLVPANLLNEGDFTIRIDFLGDRLSKLLEFTDAAVISIHETASRSFSSYGRFAGHVHPRLKWDTRFVCAE
jgi:lipopolysaccharide transport system ATP-binding protein